MYLRLKWRYWKTIFAAKNSGFWVGKYRRNKLIGEKMEHLPAELADLRCSGNWWAMQYIARKKGEEKDYSRRTLSPLNPNTSLIFHLRLSFALLPTKRTPVFPWMFINAYAIHWDHMWTIRFECMLKFWPLITNIPIG